MNDKQKFIISLALFLGTLVITLGSKLLSVQSLAIGMTLAFAIIAIHVAASTLLNRNRELNEISLCLRSLQEFHGLQCPGWLIPPSKMRDIELEFPTDEIWIVSPDLSNVAFGKPFRAIIESNMRRGVKYTYFVSDIERRIIERLNIADAAGGRKEALHIIELKNDYWGKHFPTHMIIFNPQCVGTEPVLYLELPLETAGDGLGFWVLASRQMSRYVLNTLHSKEKTIDDANG